LSRDDNEEKDVLNFIEKIMKIVEDGLNQRPVEDWLIANSCDRIRKDIKRITYKNNKLSPKVFYKLKNEIIEKVDIIERQAKKLSEEILALKIIEEE